MGPRRFIWRRNIWQEATNLKERVKKWLRPALFTLGGALAGLGYYYVVGCATGACPITSNPLSSMAYMALVGWLLSGVFGSSCCGGSCKQS